MKTYFDELIKKAANRLIEERELTAPVEDVCKALERWLEGELEEPEYLYDQSSSLQKMIFQSELKAERLATDLVSNS